MKMGGNPKSEGEESLSLDGAPLRVLSSPSGTSELVESWTPSGHTTISHGTAPRFPSRIAFTSPSNARG